MDGHDKMAEAMTRFVGSLTGNWGTHSNQLELAADLRRIAEEEEPKPASEGDGTWSRFPNLSKAAAQSEPVYRTADELIDALVELGAITSHSQKLTIREEMMRFKPPCTCDVEKAVRAERAACISVAMSCSCNHPCKDIRCNTAYDIVAGIKARGAL